MEVHELVVEMKLLERRMTLYEEKYGVLQRFSNACDHPGRMISIRHPGGMGAISRGVEAVRPTPPVCGANIPRPRQGSQPVRLASLRDAVTPSLSFRWCRFARPPANRLEPSGFQDAAHGFTASATANLMFLGCTRMKTAVSEDFHAALMAGELAECDAHDETRADFSRWKGIYETWRRREETHWQK